MTSLARSNLATVALFAAMLGLAATTARPGPDYPAYRDWSDALVRGDLEELASSQRSPRGSKLSQWLTGPALPFALPQAASMDAIDVDTSMTVMGFLAAIVSVGFLVHLFRQLSIDRPTSIFWLAAAWVASPIGYYALAFASETLAVWLVGLLVAVLFAADRRPHPLVVGLATAMLLMVRPYWVLYALPTLVSVAGRDVLGGSRRQFFVGCLAIAVPILAALAQLAIVNRWMTGDAWRFVYIFGDAGFQSIDFRHPEWGAVLWHPMRGLFVYHPAVGLGFVAMLWLMVRAPTAGERTAWGGFAAVIALNVYVQAAWFCWWQGTGVTVGMRGLVPAAVPAMAALARLVQRSSSPAFRHAVVVLTTACGAWSWLMLPPGPTDYISYAALANGIRVELDKMLDPRFIFLAMPGTFLFCGLTVVLSSLPDGKRPSFVPGAGAAALFTLWIVYVWTQLILGPQYFGWLHPKRDPFLADMRPQYQIAIAAAAAVVSGIGALVTAKFSIDWRRWCERITALVVLGAFTLFGVAALRIETGPTRIPTRPPKYPGKHYYVAEIQASWNDYETIPGFDEAKRRFRDFIIREGIQIEATTVPLPEMNEDRILPDTGDEGREN